MISCVGGGSRFDWRCFLWVDFGLGCAVWGFGFGLGAWVFLELPFGGCLLTFFCDCGLGLDLSI